MKLNPAVQSFTLSFNLISEGADIEVSPWLIAESVPLTPKVNLFSAPDSTL